jgi:hypothetical protein
MFGIRLNYVKEISLIKEPGATPKFGAKVRGQSENAKRKKN